MNTIQRTLRSLSAPTIISTGGSRRSRCDSVCSKWNDRSILHPRSKRYLARPRPSLAEPLRDGRSNVPKIT